MGVYDCCICETPIYGAKETRHANPKLAHAECIDKQNERARIEAETVAAIVAMVKDARDSCVFAVRTKDNTRERDGAVDALNGILRKIARGDHAKGGVVMGDAIDELGKLLADAGATVYVHEDGCDKRGGSCSKRCRDKFIESRGRLAERARVVAWLRGLNVFHGDVPRRIAYCIERGDHAKGGG